MRGALRRLCICALAAGAAASACLAGPDRGAHASPSPCGRLLPPASGAYLGAFADDVARATAFERVAGHTLSVVSFSQLWYHGLGFPRRQVLAIWRHGAVPSVAFLPASGALSGPGRRQQNPERRYTLQRIIDGAFDVPLRAWARGARELAVPLLLSFGSEVNDERMPWNARWNGAGTTDGYGNPDYPDGAERYRDAYRHVVKLFRAEGATNVAFVFHADAALPGTDWDGVALYYPGDAYVDWLGISVHGTRDAGDPVTPFAQRLDGSGVYSALTALSRRPAAIVGLGTGGAATVKAVWIRGAFAALRSGRYARIHAVTWGEPGDSRAPIDASAQARDAFRSGVSGSFFSAPPRFSGDCRPPPPAAVSARVYARNKVRVRWSPVPVASAYEVYRDGKLLARTKGTSLDDTTAVPNRSHTYTVRAVSPGGRSV